MGLEIYNFYCEIYKTYYLMFFTIILELYILLCHYSVIINIVVIVIT